MADSHEMARNGGSPSWPWWRWILSGLCALGLALSAYLGWHYLIGGSVIGCGGGSACDQVLSSRWSAVGGVLPISGLAAGTYLALLLASFFIGPATALPDRRLAWRAMLILAGAAGGSALWFIGVQKWAIGSFCPYCMATHITSLLLAALLLWRAPRQFDAEPATLASTTKVAGAAPAAPEGSSAARRVMGPYSAVGMAAIGVVVAGILAVCQVAMKPPPVFRSGETPSHPSPAIVPRAVPLVGSPDATSIVVLFFDYKCPHCQKLHAMLDEVIGRYDGKVAFVLCPAPLNTQCNPYVAQDVEQFKDSCALAKIALAVWVAKHEAFADFDRWMFSPEPGQPWHPRTLEAAQAKAIALVGKRSFDVATADPWVDRYLQTSIHMYGDTIDQGGNAVPKLAFGTRWVTPQPDNVDELMTILHASLGVPRP